MTYIKIGNICKEEKNESYIAITKKELYKKIDTYKVFNFKLFKCNEMYYIDITFSNISKTIYKFRVDNINNNETSEIIKHIEDMGYLCFSPFLTRIPPDSYFNGKRSNAYNAIARWLWDKGEVNYKTITALFNAGDKIKIATLETYVDEIIFNEVFINKTDIKVTVKRNFIFIEINNAILFSQPIIIKDRLTSVYEKNNIYFFNNINKNTLYEINKKYQIAKNNERKKDINRNDLAILCIEESTYAKHLTAYNIKGYRLPLKNLSFADLITTINDKNFICTKDGPGTVYIESKHLMDFAIMKKIIPSYSNNFVYYLKPKNRDTKYAFIDEDTYNKILIELRKLYSEDTVAAWILLGELGE